MKKPSRNQIYEAVIRRMVVQALLEKEERFEAEHRDDPDEALLEYFSQCARELEHTPWPKEIIGWQLLTQRFGSWAVVVEKAGLPEPTTPNKTAKFRLYREEEELQKRLYRANRAQKKEKALRRARQQLERRNARTTDKPTPPDTDGVNP